MENGLEQLANDCVRLTWNGLAVDYVDTSAGRLRIGSMPDILKLSRAYGLEAGLVVVPPWQGCMAGDNYTGEEFVLWDGQVTDGPPRTYVGAAQDVARLRSNLDHTFSWYFDPDCLNVEKKTWLDRWFKPAGCDTDFTTGQVTISVKPCIRIFDHGRLVYDCQQYPLPDGDKAVDLILKTVEQDNKNRGRLEVMPVGTGNGFSGTVSSCLVRYGRRVLWIDPGGYPAHTLARHGVHWDDVTDLFVTHNHEDHVQGISACLFRAEKTGRPIHLMTAPSIFKVLRQQFVALVPEFDSLVNFTPAEPARPAALDDMVVTTRWNHHILPYGTLGLKVSARGKTFGFSGDTKLDESINAVLGQKALLPQWFAGCDLVFHEVSFQNPKGVHTYWKAVEQLDKFLDCPVFGYHTDRTSHKALSIARQGQIYCL